MTKIKVKINPAVPPYEVISRHKNFDRFMDRYKQYYSTKGIHHLLFRDRKKLVLIVILVVFILILLFGESEATTLLQKN